MKLWTCLVIFMHNRCNWAVILLMMYVLDLHHFVSNLHIIFNTLDVKGQNILALVLAPRYISPPSTQLPSYPSIQFPSLSTVLSYSTHIIILAFLQYICSRRNKTPKQNKALLLLFPPTSYCYFSKSF